MASVVINAEYSQRFNDFFLVVLSAAERLEKKNFEDKELIKYAASYYQENFLEIIPEVDVLGRFYYNDQNSNITNRNLWESLEKVKKLNLKQITEDYAYFLRFKQILNDNEIFKLFIVKDSNKTVLKYSFSRENALKLISFHQKFSGALCYLTEVEI